MSSLRYLHGFKGIQSSILTPVISLLSHSQGSYTPFLTPLRHDERVSSNTDWKLGSVCEGMFLNLQVLVKVKLADQINENENQYWNYSLILLSHSPATWLGKVFLCLLFLIFETQVRWRRSSPGALIALKCGDSEILGDNHALYFNCVHRWEDLLYSGFFLNE